MLSFPALSFPREERKEKKKLSSEQRKHGPFFGDTYSHGLPNERGEEKKKKWERGRSLRVFSTCTCRGEGVYFARNVGGLPRSASARREEERMVSASPLFLTLAKGGEGMKGGVSCRSSLSFLIL